MWLEGTKDFASQSALEGGLGWTKNREAGAMEASWRWARPTRIEGWSCTCSTLNRCLRWMRLRRRRIERSKRPSFLTSLASSTVPPTRASPSTMSLEFSLPPSLEPSINMCWWLDWRNSTESRSWIWCGVNSEQRRAHGTYCDGSNEFGRFRWRFFWTINI